MMHVLTTDPGKHFATFHVFLLDEDISENKISAPTCLRRGADGPNKKNYSVNYKKPPSF